MWRACHIDGGGAAVGMIEVDVDDAVLGEAMRLTGTTVLAPTG
jgi:hypothetical protein